MADTHQRHTVSHAQTIESLASHMALLGLWAVGLTLAFPKPGWGWLAHVALVPVALLAVRSANPRRLLWTSYSVAMVWWLIRLGWMSQCHSRRVHHVMAACLAWYACLLHLWLDSTATSTSTTT